MSVGLGNVGGMAMPPHQETNNLDEKQLKMKNYVADVQ